jgi:hypothetical protein
VFRSFCIAVAIGIESRRPVHRPETKKAAMAAVSAISGARQLLVALLSALTGVLSLLAGFLVRILTLLAALTPLLVLLATLLAALVALLVLLAILVVLSHHGGFLCLHLTCVNALSRMAFLPPDHGKMPNIC